MKQSKNTISSFSIFFSLIIHFSLHAPLHATSTLFPKVCKNISQSDANVDYNFCVTTFGSDLRSVNAKTVTQLRAVAFQMGISKSKSILLKIYTISKDPKFDPSARDALKACHEVYLDALHGLQDGLMGLKSGDYSTANNKVNIALIVPTACEMGFEVSPLTKENSDFFQLAAISLGFIDLLH